MCNTYNCNYLKHSRFRFNLIDLKIQISLPNFAFIVKSPSVTQRSVSQENAYKKS